MNVTKLSRDVRLGSLVTASRAEGFRFVERARLELSQGDFGRPGAALFGSFADAELVGVGVDGLTPDPCPDAEPNTGRLRHLYVLSRHRRLGVGQALVTSVVREALKHYRILRLRPDKPKAARCYEALGFLARTELRETHRLELR